MGRRRGRLRSKVCTAITQSPNLRHCLLLRDPLVELLAQERENPIQSHPCRFTRLVDQMVG